MISKMRGCRCTVKWNDAGTPGRIRKYVPLAIIDPVPVCRYQLIVASVVIYRVHDFLPNT